MTSGTPEPKIQMLQHQRFFRRLVRMLTRPKQRSQKCNRSRLFAMPWLNIWTQARTMSKASWLRSRAWPYLGTKSARHSKRSASDYQDKRIQLINRLLFGLHENLSGVRCVLCGKGLPEHGARGRVL